MCDETGKKSMKIATWAIMANMPLKLKAEVTRKMLLAGSDEKKMREIMHSVSERRRLIVPRDRIERHPSIDPETCKQCVMLCTGCEGRCPEGAISFPDRKDFYKYVYYV
ncbi:MAG: hypothetical protein ACYDHX_04325 [Methanothrix sp.]